MNLNESNLPEKRGSNDRDRAQTFKKITKILQQEQTSEMSGSIQMVKLKQYSYDHLEVYKYNDFLRQIKDFQNIAKIKSCFSDVVY